MALTLLAQVRAVPGTEDQTRAEMTKLLAPTRAEAGCLFYDFYADNNDPCLFLFFEEWESRAHLEAHLQSPHLQACRAATADLGLTWVVNELSKVE